MGEPQSEREPILRGFLESFGLAALDSGDLLLALTHRSYAYEQNLPADNERLEFLGDAVIAAITSEYLYETDPTASEGLMSKRRARLVSRSLLGRRAVDMGLGELILLSRGERDTGGAARLSTLGSALEALVGVVYLRLGFAATRAFVRRHIVADAVRLAGAELAHGDYKTALQEITQQRLKQVPRYVRVGESGPDHDKQFHVRVEVAGRVLATASGARVKLAENEAARLALERLEAGQIELG